MTDGLIKIMGGICRALLTILGGIAGYQLSAMVVSLLSQRIDVDRFWIQAFLNGGSVLIFSGIGFLIAPLFFRVLGFMSSLFEKNLQTTKWQDITAATTGLFVGLLLANLMAMPFAGLPLGPYVAFFLNLVIGYVLARLFVNRQEDIRGFFASFMTLRQRLLFRKNRGESGKDDFSLAVPAKILDTSVVIDGRILDVVHAGFLEGVVVLPRFVLSELQSVADSKDPGRRARGRRGLDVVKALQGAPSLNLVITEVGLKELDVDLVDSGLIALARRIGGKILTTDYNLNKVAEIQEIVVLNVNDLANSMKPAYLPGENVIVDVIREGKEPQQGIGYLDSGTMLVVEDGEAYIGRRVEVVVTSMLQTSAGRMIFGRVRREVFS
ncbi:MAG: twitching motility protein PilT [Dethiosulfovibrio peptidovorans]|nr:MAG: twitching motility protein PilT [Dethiosulfovibrio peptidovorans]